MTPGSSWPHRVPMTSPSSAENPIVLGDAFSSDHRTHACTTSKMGDNGSSHSGVHIDMFQFHADVFKRQAVETETQQALVGQRLGQAIKLGDIGVRLVERRIETDDLAQAR